MAHLILLRHGQSQWNLENRFTGWVDVPLTPKGEEEARSAGRLISNLKMEWPQAHTSRLKRAQRTLEIVLEEIQFQPQTWKDSALNERHYGNLQGLNKDETKIKYGEDQVQLWRRSFDVAPPEGESLVDTAKRTLPYFKEYILLPCREGQNQLVVAHGNSLRSIMMFLENLTPEEILKVEIETGVPYLYRIDSAGQLLEKTILKP
jgi:2,3-bisphosphoglycerate-dependent phosphoglycerate mutase